MNRRLRPFFLTQFLGAFNDNLFKNAGGAAHLPGGELDDDRPSAAGQPGGRHLHPALLPVLGHRRPAADKYDKARLTRLVKVLEVAIMR